MTAGTLNITLPNDREIVMTRSFDAPRQLVFEACTRPELIRRWMLGSPGWTMPVCGNDLRIGGRYRFVWRGPDGTEKSVTGIHREIVPPERIVSTQEFEENGTIGETLGAIELTEREGRTSLRDTVTFATQAARDTALKTGLPEASAEGYERLNTVVAVVR